MNETTQQPIKKQKRKGYIQVKVALLLLQILLPFGLYFALEWDQSLVAGVIAGLIVLSMFVLVWLG